MNLLRKMLFPFAILYGFITSIRNFLFEIGILKSYSFSLPILAVGNLSVGGTGKTPQIEYLIRLLSDKYRIATLSRGYKRKSKGFILANSTTTASQLGDEPFQFFQKFQHIQVAVDANRKNGIRELLSQPVKPQIILLDDAFQHRKVKAGFYVLLTTYGDLYADDFILPTGNLRESSSGAKRANVVVVTKCPMDLSENERDRIEKKLKLNAKQKIFFTSIAYDEFVFSEKEKLSVSEIKDRDKVLVAGIAMPEPFFSYVQNEKDVILQFPDHHPFSESDLVAIRKKAHNKIIVTTEKDFVRLKGNLLQEQLYYLPIKSNFITNENEFNDLILSFIESQNKKRPI